MDMSLSKLWEMVMDSLVCCSPWGHKKADTTEQLNNNNHINRLKEEKPQDHIIDAAKTFEKIPTFEENLQKYNK